MADRYNIRNVASKEIYDSYMGILRISPNKYYGKDIDDPTDMLSTLVYLNDNKGQKYEDISETEEIKLQVSDSDGNMLPIYFKPKAFSTNVVLRENGNFTNDKKENLINICTHSDSPILISKSLKIRSTLNLSNPVDKQSKIAIVSGCDTKTIENNIQIGENGGILLYPIENPNDDDYINNKNRENLFSVNDDTPRHEQVEKNLLNMSLDEHIEMLDIYKEEHPNKDPRVKVNGKFVNVFNNLNENVPLYYSHDYVLGHYDGHALSKNSDSLPATRDSWMGTIKGDENNVRNKIGNGKITKLSWIRFDDLIWDALDEVLSGDVRHVKGRYDNLGKSETTKNSILETLFGENNTNDLSSTAPLLGHGVQKGLIIHHAMPLHRYLFHVARQIAYNMERWKEKYPNVNKPNNWSDYTGTCKDELNSIEEAFDNELITKSCRASITPHHSLVKDFFLCNGNTFNFESFPNVNLMNNDLFGGISFGEEAKIDKDKGTFTTKKDLEQQLEQQSDSTTAFYAISQTTTATDNTIKLPNLYQFFEAYPRFIRGQSWDLDLGMTDNDIQTFDSENAKEKYMDNVYEDSTNTFFLHSTKCSKDYIVDIPKDVFGNNAIDIKKPFSNYGLYYFNYDFLAPRQKHYHNLFSQEAGGKQNTDSSLSSTTIAHFKHENTLGKRNDQIGNFNDPYKQYSIKKNSYTESARKDKFRNDGINWLDYCLKTSNGFFHDYTPIPNIGMMLWNKDRYNTDNTDDEVYKGTYKNVEINGNQYSFLDGTGTTRTLYNDEKNWKIEEESFEDAPSWGSMNNMRTLRFKRRQQAMKLNEAEGISPISFTGFAKYQIETEHTFKRKKKLSGGDWEQGHLRIQNVSNYVLQSWGGTSNNETDEMTGETVVTTAWSCLTSLPYDHVEYLGYGNIDLINDSHVNLLTNGDKQFSNPSEYYINHNVTDKWKKYNKIKTKEVSYGNTKIDADMQSPYPSYMNLLPLIRL